MREIIKRMCHIVLQMLGEVEETYQPTVDIPSPRDLVPNKSVKYDKLKQVVTIKNIKPPIWLTTVADTNSMDATIDAGHTAILMGWFEPSDLEIGDILVYWDGNREIIHRIIAIEEDEFGKYFTFKGDNNYYADPFRVRPQQLRWLLIGIIY